MSSGNLIGVMVLRQLAVFFFKIIFELWKGEMYAISHH